MLISPDIYFKTVFDGHVLHNSLLHSLLKNSDFLNTDISQGSVATRLWCGEIFTAESNGERILKIGQYLVKLWARVRCLVFLTHGIYIYIYI